jgi:hypothetical protein
MVVATARPHRGTFQVTQARRGFARVEQSDAGVRGQRVRVATRNSRDAGELLQEVERGSFSGEDRGEWSYHASGLVARLELDAVRFYRDVFARRPNRLEHPRSSVAATQDSTGLGDHVRLALQVGVDDKPRGDVPVAHLAAEVLAQRDRDKIVELRLR